MLTLTELQEFLADQWKLIVDLNISIQNAMRLKTDKYDYEDQIKEHGFFMHHIYQLKFIKIIQLSKLFSSKTNEKRSFYKLCNKLETSDYGSDIKELMESNQDKVSDEVKSKNDIVKLVKEVRNLLDTHNELIHKIIALRDQVYAHLDNNPKIQNVSLDELKTLVQLANEIHNLIRLRIFFTQTRFDLVTHWSIDYVLYYMAENRKRILEQIEQKKKRANFSGE